MVPRSQHLEEMGETSQPSGSYLCRSHIQLAPLSHPQGCVLISLGPHSPPSQHEGLNGFFKSAGLIAVLSFDLSNHPIPYTKGIVYLIPYKYTCLPYSPKCKKQASPYVGLPACVVNRFEYYPESVFDYRKWPTAQASWRETYVVSPTNTHTKGWHRTQNWKGMSESNRRTHGVKARMQKPAPLCPKLYRSGRELNPTPLQMHRTPQTDVGGS